jgi:hypothetical protein
LLAAGACALNEQVGFDGAVAGWQFQRRNFGIVQAIGLAANKALKMHVLVMVTGSAVVVAQRVFQSTAIVQHFVDDTFVEESLECAIDRNAVVIFRHLFFYIGVRQRVVMPKKQTKDGRPAGSGPELVFFQ